jgi:16S rRNA (cytosine967-C5)-methyltransferase
VADEGLFVVQEEASQLVALLARASPGERVIDTCSSPGGKTLAMAAAMNGRGLLVAADVRSRRVDLLRRTLAQAGLAIPVVQLDLLAPLPFAAVFDCVFVDAPCSGMGTIRRDPEIRWRRTAEDLVELAAAQRRMLDHAARIVRPGGRLVYATCSSEPEENEEVVGEFMHGHRDFVPRERAEVVAALPAAAAALVSSSAELRTWPWRDGLEAFFGAGLRRLSSA